MDDPKIASSLSKIQSEMVKDEEVVLNYTKMNHLQLRVKNVAVTKLISCQNRKDWRQSLNSMSAEIAKSKDKLKRQNTSSLDPDKLIGRLRDKMVSTKEKIDTQREALERIKKNVDEMCQLTTSTYADREVDSSALDNQYEEKKVHQKTRKQR